MWFTDDIQVRWEKIVLQKRCVLPRAHCSSLSIAWVHHLTDSNGSQVFSCASKSGSGKLQRVLESSGEASREGYVGGATSRSSTAGFRRSPGLPIAVQGWVPESWGFEVLAVAFGWGQRRFLERSGRMAEQMIPGCSGARFWRVHRVQSILTLGRRLR